MVKFFINESRQLLAYFQTPLLQDLYLAIKRPEPVNFDKDMVGIAKLTLLYLCYSSIVIHFVTTSFPVSNAGLFA